MINLLIPIEVQISDADGSYNQSANKWYTVVGVLTTRKMVNMVGSDKQELGKESDHFMIINDEGRISTPFISKCKIRILEK